MLCVGIVRFYRKHQLRQGTTQQGSTGRENFYVEFIFHRNVQDRSLRGSLIVCQRFSYFCSREIISEKCLCYVFVIEASISSNWCRTPEYDINCQTWSETAPLDMLHVKSRLFFSLQSKSKHEMCLVFVTNTPLFIQLLTVESIYWVRFQHNIIKFWSIQNVIMTSHNHRPHHHQHHQYSRRRWFG